MRLAGGADDREREDAGILHSEDTLAAILGPTHLAPAGGLICQCPGSRGYCLL